MKGFEFNKVRLRHQKFINKRYINESNSKQAGMDYPLTSLLSFVTHSSASYKIEENDFLFWNSIKSLAISAEEEK